MGGLPCAILRWACGLCLFASFINAQTFDLVLHGGRVIDGTGSPAFLADVGITNGRIAFIGKITGEARKELDAQGYVVAPGFIDVHTHAEDIEELPLAENFVRMGVTTVVMGNCGSSALNVGQFLRRLEAANISINAATLIGHGTVRKKAMEVPSIESRLRKRWRK